MPSAFYDERRNGWIADYRPLFAKTHRKVRVPLARILSADTAKADAKAFADELDRYCRLLEKGGADQDVAHALRIGAITEAEGRAYLAGEPVAPQAGEPLTIKRAAMSHPSSQRDKRQAQQWGLKCVDDFVTFTGVEHLHLVTLDHFMLYVKELRARGWAWDTRKHALSYLRRATKMGTRAGIADVVAGMRIDGRDSVRTPIRVWTLDHLVGRILATDDAGVRMALILGGLLGCRPTEILRAEAQDFTDDVLRIGQREAKNAASVRSLALPTIVARWMRKCLGQRTSGPLVKPYGPRRRSHYTLSGLHQLTAEALAGPPRIKPKDLRKTFATWASRVITASDLEHFLGHETVLRAAVTERHYLEAHQVDDLRPAAKLLDAAITGAALAAQRRPQDTATA